MKLFDIFVTEAGDSPAWGSRPKPTATKTATDWEKLFQDPLTTKPKDLPTTTEPLRSTGNTEHGSARPSPTIRTASADTTRQRTAGVGTPDMAAKLSKVDMNAPDLISNDQARANAGLDTTNQVAVRTTPSDLPAVMSRAMANTEVNPEWHMVKNLPGYLASGIRSIGRAVFAPFTSTPIEQIQVLANLGGNAPNSQREINAVVGFLKQNGERNSEAEIKFHDKIPDYDAKLQVYTAMGYTFVLVKDFAGNYIYSWPTADGDGLNIGGESPALPSPTRRLR